MKLRKLYCTACVVRMWKRHNEYGILLKGDLKKKVHLLDGEGDVKTMLKIYLRIEIGKSW
jgi:hypothetical protein